MLSLKVKRVSAAALALTVVLLVLAASAPTDRAATASGATPEAQTLRKAVWGVTEHDGTSMFPIYRDLGVGIFQTQARWDQIAARRPADPTNPRDPAYVWPAYLDRAIAEAATYGITVTIQVIGAPGWATGGRAWNWAPENPSDFGAFAAAISRRYPAVRHWMV